MKKILICVGTRPNLIKITQFARVFSAFPDIEYQLLHTGQHFDYNMNDVFFDELKIRKPDVFLNINQGGQISVIARIMEEFEKFIQSNRPDMVVVPGDVNSSFACAFVAQRHGISVAHIESGLRSFDMSMPEEVNRILIDSLANLYFVTEPSGVENLLREGKTEEKINFVGNTMIDSLVAFMPLIDKSMIRDRLNLNKYYLLTFHRPANVDNRENLTLLVNLIVNLSEKRQIVFPMHPRTKKRIEEFGLLNKLDNKNILLTEPFGYVDFIHLIKNAQAVITDSGGVQEETTFMAVPCITVRSNTERPITITEGSNKLVELDVIVIKNALNDIECGNFKKGKVPMYWDGKSSERIAKVIHQFVTQ